MMKVIDDNRLYDQKKGVYYMSVLDRDGDCAGCNFGPIGGRFCRIGHDPGCASCVRRDGRSVIWVRDERVVTRCDNPSLGPITRDACPGEWRDRPAPVLRLTPPVDAADLARTLVSLRPGKRLVVSVEDGCIVVREADNG